MNRATRSSAFRCALRAQALLVWAGLRPSRRSSSDLRRCAWPAQHGSALSRRRSVPGRGRGRRSTMDELDARFLPLPAEVPLVATGRVSPKPGLRRSPRSQVDEELLDELHGAARGRGCAGRRRAVRVHPRLRHPADPWVVAPDAVGQGFSIRVAPGARITSRLVAKNREAWSPCPAGFCTRPAALVGAAS